MEIANIQFLFGKEGQRVSPSHTARIYFSYNFKDFPSPAPTSL